MSEERDEQENLVQKRILGLSIILTLVGGIVTYLFLMPAWYQNYAPEQPIPFSHKLHAGQYEIPCLYCHGSAEYADFAAVPGLETCMNCHNVVKTDSPWIQQIQQAYESNTPIAWVKVHVMPDFVHFNHSRHIAAGVECQTCHGPVQEMEKVYQYERMTMGWCMECHRNDDYLTPSRVEFFDKKAELSGRPLVPQWTKFLMGHPEPFNADVSCSTCHH
jgi:hypothetical protein